MEQNIPENTESTAIPQPSTLAPSPSSPLSPRAMAGIVLVSLVAGIAGGVYGGVNLANRPGIQKLLSKDFNGNAINQTVTLTEESATTKVVAESSAAVVSIVISKDLSRMPGFGFDPFGLNSSGNAGPQGLQEIGAGSGFFVNSDGLILTNKHVVADTKASYSVVTNDGKTYDAQVLARDPVNDLALVKINVSNVKYLSFADSTHIQLGEHVVAIGNSLGQYQNTVTSGIVSGVGRSITAGDQTGSELLEGVSSD